jgi:uncharacterized protein (TIGR03118 family)
MISLNRMVCRLAISLSLSLATTFFPPLVSTAAAQYTTLKLFANTYGNAIHTDPNLVNAWGLAFFPGSPFWISDNGNGLSTLCTTLGLRSVPLVVTVPAAAGSTAKGSPTGIVANGTGEFVVTQGTLSGSAVFIYDTLDGTISGWSPGVNSTQAVIAVDNSGIGASYTGLTIATNTNAQNFIYAANNASGWVEVYDGNFNLVNSFADPALPAGFTPYGIQAIGSQIFVTFVNFALPGAGNGYLDAFDTSGNVLQRYTPQGMLNFPWGLALAPSNFGPFSNDLLVGDVGDGRINAFNTGTGAFAGQLTDVAGNALSINGLWALVFGAGSSKNGPKLWLFYTAGPNNFAGGAFGAILASRGY